MWDILNLGKNNELQKHYGELCVRSLLILKIDNSRDEIFLANTINNN